MMSSFLLKIPSTRSQKVAGLTHAMRQAHLRTWSTGIFSGCNEGVPLDRQQNHPIWTGSWLSLFSVGQFIVVAFIKFISFPKIQFMIVISGRVCVTQILRNTQRSMTIESIPLLLRLNTPIKEKIFCLEM